MLVPRGENTNNPFRIIRKNDQVDVILNGVPGTPMPPWRGEISPDEARWLVLQLRNGKGAARVR